MHLPSEFICQDCGNYEHWNVGCIYFSDYLEAKKKMAGVVIPCPVCKSKNTVHSYSKKWWKLMKDKDFYDKYRRAEKAHFSSIPKCKPEKRIFR